MCKTFDFDSQNERQKTFPMLAAAVADENHRFGPVFVQSHRLLTSRMLHKLFFLPDAYRVLDGTFHLLPPSGPSGHETVQLCTRGDAMRLAESFNLSINKLRNAATNSLLRRSLVNEQNEHYTCCGYQFQDYVRELTMVDSCLLYTSPSPRDRG